MPTRRLPVPITFLVVVTAIICLIIFFGAWAASVDVEDRSQSLSFGFVGGAIATNADTITSSQGSFGEGSRVDDANVSWWGSAFLKACPLH